MQQERETFCKKLGLPLFLLLLPLEAKLFQLFDKAQSESTRIKMFTLLCTCMVCTRIFSRLVMETILSLVLGTTGSLTKTTPTMSSS